MICPNCGAYNISSEAKCFNCKTVLTTPVRQENADAGSYGGYPDGQYQQPPQSQQYYQPEPQQYYQQPQAYGPAGAVMPGVIYCHKCGRQLDSQAVICPSCGVATSNFAAQQAQPNIIINNANNNANTNVNNNMMANYVYKKKWVALILCFFFGFLGVHRFYTGKVGTGLLWLVTFGFFFIGWALDFLFILFGGFRDKFGQPLM